MKAYGVDDMEDVSKFAFEWRLEGGEEISLGHPRGKYSGLYSLCRDRGMAGVSEEQVGQHNYEQNKMGIFQDSLKRESQK